MNRRFFYPQITQITQIISRESQIEKKRNARRVEREGYFLFQGRISRFFNLRNLCNLRINKRRWFGRIRFFFSQYAGVRFTYPSLPIFPQKESV
jgi:hypothetical protein